jgi:predicted permease
MEAFMRDVRYTMRALLKTPGFTLVAVLSLALGIGANTAIYSIIHAVLLRPLPVEEPERLVQLAARSLPYPVYADILHSNSTLSDAAAFSAEQFSLNVGERAEVISGSFVTGNYFDVLGVRPSVGRTFLPDEDRTPATHPVAVISHSLWQRAYGGASDVTGQTILLNDYPLTIVGVAPRGFRGTNLTLAPEVWIPIQMWTPLATGEALRLKPERRTWGWLAAFGRLKEGVTFDQVRAEMSTIASQIKQAHPRETPRSFSIEPAPLAIAATGLRGRSQVVRFVLILAGIVGIVLLIACANVANLLLARAIQRRKEIAVRLALGATRRRIVRQLLTESFMLATLGGGLGLLFAMWAIDTLAAYELPGRIAISHLGLDLSREALVFTLLTSIVTAVLFGLLPALQSSRTDLVTVIKGEESAHAFGRLRLRGALLAVQVALCLVLLVGAGLFVRSLQKAIVTDPGFDVEKIALLSVNLGLQRYTEARAENFYGHSVERAEALPYVESASWTTSPQMAQVAPYSLFVSYEGYEPREGEEPEAEFNYVGDDYFKTMGISLVRGRDFGEADIQGATPVAIVNETVARRYFFDRDPVGRSLRVGGRPATIIGVARDSKYHRLTEEGVPYVYMPLKQNLANVGLETLTLLVRAKGDPAAALAGLREEIKSIDPTLPITGAMTMREHIGRLLMAQRFGSTLLGLFSALTLLLASIGIYGVVAYSVTQRTREIGIRMALGASRKDILKLVVAKSLLPVGVGVAAGLAAALVLTRAINSFLFDVSATDPASFAAAVLLLGLTALVAGYVPARRATRVDPMTALRYE